MSIRLVCASLVWGLICLSAELDAASLEFDAIDVPSTPYGLNSSGLIVGTFAGGELTGSYLFSQTGLLNIALPGASRMSTFAYRINNASQIWELPHQFLLAYTASSIQTERSQPSACPMRVRLHVELMTPARS
jgi:hypothetical protein